MSHQWIETGAGTREHRKTCSVCGAVRQRDKLCVLPRWSTTYPHGVSVVRSYMTCEIDPIDEKPVPKSSRVALSTVLIVLGATAVAIAMYALRCAL